MKITIGRNHLQFFYGFGMIEGAEIDSIKIKNKKYGYQVHLHSSMGEHADVYFIDIETALYYINLIHSAERKAYSLYDKGPVIADINIYNTYKEVKDIIKSKKRRERI